MARPGGPLPPGASTHHQRPSLVSVGRSLLHQRGVLLRTLPDSRAVWEQERSKTCIWVPHGGGPSRPMAAAPADRQRRGTAAASSADPAAAPPPPPFSQLSVPVYSLATVGPDGSGATMNLMIYASAISLTPRHYAIGLYQNTLSRENMLATRRGVLQVLGEQHAQLFQLLGKTSGRQVDKLAQLAELGFQTQEWHGVPTLADCCGLMELEFATDPYDAGDHDVAICKVVDYHTVSADTQPLYTGYLRQLGVY